MSLMTMKKRSTFPIASYLALFILVILIYLNALQNDFVWDDNILIADNPLVKDGWRAVPTFFAQSHFDVENQGMSGSYHYRPIISVSWLLDYFMWGLRPGGFHLTNILLHSVNVILFFYFFRLLLQDERGALWASLLFASSPVHTNVVSYIMGRTDLFATLFFLGSLLLYDSFSRRIDRWRLGCLAGSTFFFALALLSKEIAVTLPAIVILYDLCITGRLKTGKALWKAGSAYAPFILILAGYFLLRRLIIEHEIGFAVSSLSDALVRAATILASIGLYWKLLLFPVGLSYERSIEVIRSVSSPAFLGGLALVCACIVLLVRWWNRDRTLVFCLGWFFVTFLPASNILPVFPSLAATHLYMAEHFLYLPSMGLFALAGVFISTLSTRMYDQFGGRWKPYALGAPVFVVILLLSVLTVRRTGDWRDEETFFKQSLAVNPASVRMLNNLGIVYIQQNRYEEALKLFEAALDIQPDSVISYNNIAAVYQDFGLWNEAVGLYRTAISLDATNLTARFELGKLLAEAGRLEEAKEHFSFLTERYPAFSPAHHELGRILMAEGHYPGALAEFEEALKNSPSPGVVLNSIGILYARQDKLEQAAAYFRRALKANPQSYNALVNLGNVCLVRGLEDEAVRHYERALSIRSDLPGLRERVVQLRAK
ncbi:MAG: tetratricopeptide repeat protein [Candidatus Abyssobacteria bacterium SURF_17]|uniref:Tetratricopeptide repeat protein n=1 Tax=Candidatus Abyssobacteria bacterium SURF_17 TaxID=2093361 RepID=A0A419F6C5_9BACT|nr:MAG: tetratricopeptide repeat protein [Candidatus Abyssubacteria bacterium SURF_17]